MMMPRHANTEGGELRVLKSGTPDNLGVPRVGEMSYPGNRPLTGYSIPSDQL